MNCQSAIQCAVFGSVCLDLLDEDGEKKKDGRTRMGREDGRQQRQTNLRDGMERERGGTGYSTQVPPQHEVSVEVVGSSPDWHEARHPSMGALPSRAARGGRRGLCRWGR